MCRQRGLSSSRLHFIPVIKRVRSEIFASLKRASLLGCLMTLFISSAASKDDNDTSSSRRSIISIQVFNENYKNRFLGRGSYLPCMCEKTIPSASQVRASFEKEEVCRRVPVLSNESTIVTAAAGNEVGQIPGPKCCKDSISLASPYNTGAQVALTASKASLIEDLTHSRTSWRS